MWLDGSAPRPGRITWVQDEPDGSIVGVCFLDDGNDGSPGPSRSSS